MEDKIKGPADKKFRAIQTAITDKLKTEMQQAVRNEIKEEVMKGLEGTEILQMVKEEIKEDLRKEMQGTPTQQITTADLDKMKGEILDEVQTLNKERSAEANHNSLKGQVFARRLNIIIFGISDNNPPEVDTQLAHNLFKDQMGITGLNILHTYRLGLPH